jgi:histone-lysine N-methyltransferase SETD2
MLTTLSGTSRKKTVVMLLLAAYPEVLVMDCTYKSNRFSLPLFNIVGMTASNSTFFVAFTFLKHEREADYTWSLKQLRAYVGGNFSPKVVITD